MLLDISAVQMSDLGEAYSQSSSPPYSHKGHATVENHQGSDQCSFMSLESHVQEPAADEAESKARINHTDSRITYQAYQINIRIKCIRFDRFIPG